MLLYVRVLPRVERMLSYPEFEHHRGMKELEYLRLLMRYLEEHHLCIDESWKCMERDYVRRDEILIRPVSARPCCYSRMFAVADVAEVA